MRRIALPAVGLMLLPTPVAALSLACWWFIVAAEMPGKTYLRRGIFAVLVVYATNASALTALAVLHRPCDPRLLLAVLLAAGLIWRLSSSGRGRVDLASSAERWALGYSVLTFVALSREFLGASLGETMAHLSPTTDAGTHFHLLVGITRARGYLQFDQPSGLAPGGQDYPTGWHGNVWILSDLLFGAAPTTSELLRLMAIAAVASYALLAGVAACVLLELRPEGTRLRPLAAAGGLAALSLAALLGFGTFLLQLASYTQILAVASVLTLLLLATDARSGPCRSLIVMTAAGITVAQSWYLLAPLLATAALVGVLSARLRPKPVAAALMISAPLWSYPILTGPRTPQVDLGGPILLPTLVGVLGLLMATSAGVVTTARNRPTALGRALLATTVTALIMLVGLVAMQGFQPGSGVSYYGAKVLLTALLLGAVLASSVIVNGLLRPAASPRAAAAVAFVGLAMGSGSTASLTIPPHIANYDTHKVASTLDAIFRTHPRGTPPGTEVWVASGCDHIADMIATKWLYDATLTWTPALQEDLNDYAPTPRGDVSAIERHLREPELQTLELFVHGDCTPDELTRLSSNPKVRIERVPG